MNDILLVVEGNGEINVLLFSFSILLGNVIFFECDSKQGFSSGEVKKWVRFGLDWVVIVLNFFCFCYIVICLYFVKLYCFNVRNMLIFWKIKCLDVVG